MIIVFSDPHARHTKYAIFPYLFRHVQRQSLCKMICRWYNFSRILLHWNRTLFSWSETQLFPLASARPGHTWMSPTLALYHLLGSQCRTWKPSSRMSRGSSAWQNVFLDKSNARLQSHQPYVHEMNEMKTHLHKESTSLLSLRGKIALRPRCRSTFCYQYSHDQLHPF